MTSSIQHLLFVGSYSAADQPGIHAFAFDAVTGTLSSLGSFSGIEKPSFLVVHPNGRWLYAVSETSKEDDGTHGAVWGYRIEQKPLTIQLINQQSTQGNWPCHMQIDATGCWLLASNYGTGNVVLFPILPDGALGEMKDFAQHHGHGPNTARQEGPHAHSATFTPDNGFAIVADLGIDQLVIYALDVEAGRLRPHAVTQTRPGAGPRHVAFHPDIRRAYVANELDNTITTYDYDAASGRLNELDSLDTLPLGAPENTVADIHVSSSGERVYVSNRGHNSVAVYAVGTDGRLTCLTILSCGGKWPRNFALAPGGNFMLVANEHSHEIVVLPILAGTAELGAAVARAAVKRPACVQFAID